MSPSLASCRLAGPQPAEVLSPSFLRTLGVSSKDLESASPTDILLYRAADLHQFSQVSSAFLTGGAQVCPETSGHLQELGGEVCAFHGAVSYICLGAGMVQRHTDRHLPYPDQSSSCGAACLSHSSTGGFHPAMQVPRKDFFAHCLHSKVRVLRSCHAMSQAALELTEAGCSIMP